MTPTEAPGGLDERGVEAAAKALNMEMIFNGMCDRDDFAWEAWTQEATAALIAYFAATATGGREELRKLAVYILLVWAPRR